MSIPITKIALAGATGNLGPSILQALLSASFQVTVLTRASNDRNPTTTTSSLPPTFRVIPVDYSSLPSLVSALRGQDAVVSALSSSALVSQLLLIKAAAQAGVRRFIPSEFGSNTLHPRTAAFPAYRDKVAVQEALKQEAAREGGKGMTWTAIINGPFLDWGIEVGFVLDVKRRRAVLYDGGERVFSTTTLPTIGRAVVGVLRNLEQTENLAVFVHDTAVTLKGLYEMGRKATPGEEWTDEVVSLEKDLEDAWTEVRKEKPDPGKFVMKFIHAAIWGEDYGAYFEKTDNGLLGIKELSEEELQAIVSRYA
ncbi:hypothetical protein VTJ04DRAFT_2862 [Mycothermus thermophilus]|uniref:uncharacterized protein n=1 Tax=Humicola insolens TaxID=85995 RepID=UPI0037447A71